MRDALKALFAKLFSKDTNDSVWDREDWNGSTEAGFYTTYEINMEKLNQAIDEFCDEMEQK